MFAFALAGWTTLISLLLYCWSLGVVVATTGLRWAHCGITSKELPDLAAYTQTAACLLQLVRHVYELQLGSKLLLEFAATVFDVGFMIDCLTMASLVSCYSFPPLVVGRLFAVSPGKIPQAQHRKDTEQIFLRTLIPLTVLAGLTFLLRYLPMAAAWVGYWVSLCLFGAAACVTSFLFFRATAAMSRYIESTAKHIGTAPEMLALNARMKRGCRVVVLVLVPCTMAAQGLLARQYLTQNGLASSAGGAAAYLLLDVLKAFVFSFLQSHFPRLFQLDRFTDKGYEVFRPERKVVFDDKGHANVVEVTDAGRKRHSDIRSKSKKSKSESKVKNKEGRPAQPHGEEHRRETSHDSSSISEDSGAHGYEECEHVLSSTPRGVGGHQQRDSSPSPREVQYPFCLNLSDVTPRVYTRGSSTPERDGEAGPNSASATGNSNNGGEAGPAGAAAASRNPASEAGPPSTAANSTTAGGDAAAAGQLSQRSAMPRIEHQDSAISLGKHGGKEQNAAEVDPVAYIHNDVMIQLAKQKARFWRDPDIRGWRDLFTFPNPINSTESRLHAYCAACLFVLAVLSEEMGWPPVALAYVVYGYGARALAGPRFDPQAHIVIFVLRPLVEDRWGLLDCKFSPGPPKQFAQSLGFVFSGLALICKFFAPTKVFYGFVYTMLLLTSWQATFDLCLGCLVFFLLIKAELIPSEVCEVCATSYSFAKDTTQIPYVAKDSCQLSLPSMPAVDVAMTPASPRTRYAALLDQQPSTPSPCPAPAGSSEAEAHKLSSSEAIEASVRPPTRATSLSSPPAGDIDVCNGADLYPSMRADMSVANDTPPNSSALAELQQPLLITPRIRAKLLVLEPSEITPLTKQRALLVDPATATPQTRQMLLRLRVVNVVKEEKTQELLDQLPDEEEMEEELAHVRLIGKLSLESSAPFESSCTRLSNAVLSLRNISSFDRKRSWQPYWVNFALNHRKDVSISITNQNQQACQLLAGHTRSTIIHA
eukprot:g16528.t1